MTEDKIEENALEILQSIGWQVIHGPDILATSDQQGERTPTDGVIENRVRSALARLNPDVSASALGEAYKKIVRSNEPDLLHDNRQFHQLAIDGVDIETRIDDEVLNPCKVGVACWRCAILPADIVLERFTAPVTDVKRRVCDHKVGFKIR